MKINQYPIVSKSICVCLAMLSVSMMLAGCTGSKVSGARTQNPDPIAIDDFIHPDATLTQSANIPHQESPSISTELPTHSQSGITLTSQPSKETPTAPQTPASGAINGALVLLDAKVGDVNGKPIFTNSFFEPIENRLITQASQLSVAQWRRSAEKLIRNRLNGIITDELLRAEALTSLTPTQRVGLQAFLNNFRSDLLSKNLGSSQLASRRMKQEEGVTLDQALKQKEIDTLVQLTLIQEVNKRVNVSWRDIKQRYELDIDKFSPPPTAVLRVIRTFSDNAEKVAQIQSQLDGGEDFTSIAQGDLNNYSTETEGLLTVVIEESFETTEFFGAPALNAQTQQLSVGEAIGPIDLGSTTYWVKLIDIEQKTISLYDAQLGIQRELTYERRTQARNQYLNRLMERARVSSSDEVLLRLLEIADQRYGPKG